MKRQLVALTASAWLLVLGAGTASAETGLVPTGASESVTALGSNTAGVRVNDDGDSGDVRQSNSNESGDAVAVNGNKTSQSNKQEQDGGGGDATSGDATGGSGSSGCGCSGKSGSGGDAYSGDADGGDVDQSQDASNDNTTNQTASAHSTAGQVAPSNSNVSVRILSHGDEGDVEQSNHNESGDAYAANGNRTDQSNDQEQDGWGGDAESGKAHGGDGGSGGDADSGDAYGGDVTQDQYAANDNSTNQDASASSTAMQFAPSNSSLSVRVLSDGDGGDVRQSNSNRSGDAYAGNWNETHQSNRQDQDGRGGDAESGDARGGDGGDGCGCHGTSGSGGDAHSGAADGGDVTQSQDAANSNETWQHARAYSTAKQIAPTNTNESVRVKSYGHDGTVEQRNSNRSGDAFAGNWNETSQSNRQDQDGWGGDARSGDATAGDAGRGCGCSGKSGGGGDAHSGDADGGDVSQSQTASNTNSTDQNAYAKSKAFQFGPTNVNGGTPVRNGAEPKTVECGGCGSEKHGGDVRQSNSNRSGDAFAGNWNETSQSNEQDQDGWGGDAESGDARGGEGGSSSKCERGCEPRPCEKSCFEPKPCGESKPCGKDSHGGGDATTGDADGGDVNQSQSASNTNSTDQRAYAKSKAFQWWPSNTNVPGGGVMLV